MKKIIKNILNNLPYVKGLFLFKKKYTKNACYEPGHYYSVIVDVNEIKTNEKQIWKNIEVDGLSEINFNVDEQQIVFKEIAKYYSDFPFDENSQDNFRYYLDNGYFRHSDALFLYGMIRYKRPSKIIEIGSGFSSALMLDTNNLHFDNTIDLIFIEPYPARLFSLLRKNDYQNTEIIKKKVQDVSLDCFKNLKSGDILFVDSSHVSKCGSDLNFILFEILPLLQSGVIIHFHDIFYPFEYPKEWVYKGFNWNENYILRAFLMNNEKYSIKLFSHYLHIHHSQMFANYSIFKKDFGGSLWIEKK